jgi:hypothetical protein
LASFVILFFGLNIVKKDANNQEIPAILKNLVFYPFQLLKITLEIASRKRKIEKMKKISLVTFLATIIPLYASGAVEKSLEEKLITTNSPTEQICGFEGKLLLHKEGTLACMLADKKNVFWGAAIWYKNFSDDIKALMKKKGIEVIELANKNEMIWYTPSGKKNAALLQKYQNQNYQDYQSKNEMAQALGLINTYLPSVEELTHCLATNVLEPLPQLPISPVAQHFFNVQKEFTQGLEHFRQELRIQKKYFENRLEKFGNPNNPYLVGKLLGYTEQQMQKNYPGDYASDKQAAEEWLKKHGSE